MKGTKIWAMIAVACIAIGIGLASAGTVSGGTWNMSFDWENLKFIDESKNFIKENIKTDSFEKLEVNSSIIDVNVKYGDEYSVEYYLPESRKPEITNEDGCLKVMIKEKHTINFFNLGIGSKGAYINITIPEKDKEKVFVIKTSTGDISVEDLMFTGTINASTGDVKLDSDRISDLEINLTTGDIEMNDCSAGSITTSSSTGDVKIKKLACDSVNVSTSTGDIKMNDLTAENVRVSASTGDIGIELNGDRADYGMELKTSTGSVKVDDEKMSKSYVKEAEDGFSIFGKTSTGDIKIKFN